MGLGVSIQHCFKMGSLLTEYSLGVMLGVYCSGKSGAHLNPAVTMANCIFRKFPWRKLPIYLVAQVLGAFCAAGVVYANYKSAFDQFEGYGIRTVSVMILRTIQM